MRYINVNGRLFKDTNASVPYDNRAFRFGFGLFETMLMADGQVQLKEYHWDRLFGALADLEFVMPELMTREWIEEEIKKTVKKNKMEKLCRIRFQIYAGRGGLYDGQNPWSEFVIECYPVEPQLLQLNNKGISLGIAEGVRKAPDTIANYKTCNAMIYAVAARQALARKLDGNIVLNTRENALETTYANLFCTKKDKIYTPPLTEGPVAGVMRRYVMEQLSERGFSVVEEPLTQDFLADADAVFITNAVRRIKWVERVEDKTYSINKIMEVYENIQF